MPPGQIAFLAHQFGLSLSDVYRGHDTKVPPFVPGVPDGLAHKGNLFEVIRQGDVLLHHPFETFLPVLEFIRQAAEDADVLAVRMTLYRTSAESPIVDALIDAANAGKDVTAVVELRARFDEAANIKMATRLQEAGVNVVYGIVGYKTHAKVIMVIRREEDRLRRYLHLGTGNYHPGTSRAYTDVGLLTCDEVLGEDLHSVFTQLTGLGRLVELEKVLQSPFTLQKRIVALIDAEAEAARAGRPAHIQARMNSLTEPPVIQALYRASQAGVTVQLLVRGVCRLRPGVPGLSETISVRSVVGRFLEHSRVFRFHADGGDLVYCGSADWMERNLHRRVEVVFPIEDPTLKARVIDETLERYFADNAQAWVGRPDGTYVRAEVSQGEPRRCAQDELMALLGAQPC